MSDSRFDRKCDMCGVYYDIRWNHTCKREGLQPLSRAQEGPRNPPECRCVRCGKALEDGEMHLCPGPQPGLTDPFHIKAGPRKGFIAPPPVILTARDQLAMAVNVEGEYSEPWITQTTGIPKPTGNTHDRAMWWAEARARLRYIEADAMLRVRELPTPFNTPKEST